METTGFWVWTYEQIIAALILQIIVAELKIIICYEKKQKISDSYTNYDM